MKAFKNLFNKKITTLTFAPDVHLYADKINYDFAGMQDGWLEPTKELEELYIAYMNYVRKEITNNESISQIK